MIVWILTIFMKFQYPRGCEVVLVVVTFIGNYSGQFQYPRGCEVVQTKEGGRVVMPIKVSIPVRV